MALREFYQDNVLNQFDSYTYKWKLMMVHPATAHKFEELLDPDTGAVVVLAESGVESEINIASVDHSLTLAFKRNQDRLGVGNMFSFNLIEPGGATFFTRIIEAARRLRIENHLAACYLLELRFIGTKDMVTTDNIVGPYYYICTTSGVTMDYSDGGTTYRMDLVETKTEAFRPQQLFLKEDTGTITANTFGQFCEQLTQIINKQEEDRAFASNAQLFPDTYTFGVDEKISEWNSWTFGAAGAQGDTGLKGTSVTGTGTLTFNFSQGTAVSDCVVVALLHTNQMRTLPAGNGGFHKQAPEDGEAKAPTFKELSSWFVFDTEVVFGYYDYQREMYQKHIEYKIVKYLTSNLVHDPISYDEVFNSKNIQVERLKNIFKSGLLRKRFDYTFTGLNTEVMNLDISLQNTFFHLQAIKHGAISTRFKNFDGAGDELNDFNLTNKELDELLKKRRKLDIQAQKIQGQLEQDMSMDIRDRLNLEDQLNNINTQIQQQGLSDEIIKEAEDKVRDAYKKLPKREERLDPVLNKDRYITQSELRTNTLAEKEKILPASFAQNVVNSKATRGPDNEDAGAVMLGAVELNLNTLGDLQQQVISIRGDPYWLGKPKGSKAQFEGANYTVGGLNYFLNLNFPTYPDETTGFMDIARQNFGIVGVYRVTQAQAMYADGQFTMTLQSFRDLSTNTGLVLEELLSGVMEVSDYRMDADTFKNQQEYEDAAFGDGEQEGEFVEQDDGTSEESAKGDATGNVTESQSSVAAIRKKAIKTELKNILKNAAVAAGVNVDVRSGGQDSTTGFTGSTRHNNGNAADVALLDASGRRLSLDNPGDVAIIKTFIKEAKKNGALGIGAGNGYMGNNTFHIDIAKDGYWGGLAENGKFRTKNAPGWLGDIHRTYG